jgi:hypothetical protein
MWQISMDLGVWDDPSLQAVLEEDQAAVTRVLLQMLFSPSDERTVLALEEDAAQSVMNTIQYVRTQAPSNFATLTTIFSLDAATGFIAHQWYK